MQTPIFENFERLRIINDMKKTRIFQETKNVTV